MHKYENSTPLSELLPLLLDGSFAQSMHVPARPVNYIIFLRLSMVIMVLVQLVATLGPLKLALNRLTSLLADNCQASSKPVQQGLQV